MNRHLISVLAAAAIAAACSSPGSYDLGGGSNGNGSTDGNGNNGNGSSGNPSTDSGTGNTSDPGGGNAPPNSGPGSSGSQAHQFFVSQVYPAMSNCVTCHANGTQGAPKIFANDAATSYQYLDANGLIQTPSLLQTKGSHEGPALTDSQAQLIAQWLQLESKERTGQQAPVNILAQMGDCLDQTKFNAIGFQNLRTVPRDGENTNRCTGCNKTPCRACHDAGDGGFYMAVGSNLDDQTFAQTKTATYIVKYIGLNGTQVVPSNAIQNKSDAVINAPAYTPHPAFQLSDTMKSALDAFVNDAITKYNNKQCGQSTGTTPDGGTGP